MAKFNRDKYQAEFMAVRREADKAGFGGSRNPAHPKYNPNYKTNKEYLAWKAGKK